jgi:hypothetical protein
MRLLAAAAAAAVSLCRGPFSGGKVMHAHLCGRLPYQRVSLLLLLLLLLLLSIFSLQGSFLRRQGDARAPVWAAAAQHVGGGVRPRTASMHDQRRRGAVVQVRRQGLGSRVWGFGLNVLGKV